MNTPEFFDVHAHVNIAAFADDWHETIERTLEAKTWHIDVGTQRDTSARAVEIAEQFPRGVYAAVGLHPVHTGKSYHDTQELGEGGSPPAGGFTSRGEVFDYDYYKSLALHPSVVAIGECGLDYYRGEPDMLTKQREAFDAQIALAEEVGKPLMLHIRSGKEGNAYRDAAVMLAGKRVRGDVHFFAGNWEDARLFLDLGFTLSFTGVITFARDYDETVRNAPLSSILTETDSPYISPAPYRGTRNEPLHVRAVVEAIAQVRNEPFEAVGRTVVENAMRVFGVSV